jgi:hypothetical protein
MDGPAKECKIEDVYYIMDITHGINKESYIDKR